MPLTRAVVRKEKPIEQIYLTLVAGLGVVLAALIVNGLMWSVFLWIFGETTGNSQGPAAFFPDNAWQSFFLLPAGAGIAEETTYRLVFLSLFWRWTRRPGVAIVLSSLVFGVYHLSPLDAVYRQYWGAP